jgi:DnaJ like chaperone protein
MSWKGKMFGAVTGFFIGGGPVGAVIGGILGHQLDKASTRSSLYLNAEEQQSVQKAFFTTTFSVMGHLAKADGIVSKAEINLATQVMDQMHLSADKRLEAIELFQSGKKNDFPLIQTLADFQHHCSHRTHLPIMFLEIQMQAAFADGQLHENEEVLLLTICQHLTLTQRHYLRIKRRLEAQQRFYQYYQQQQSHAQPYSKNNLKDAYDVLGVNSKSKDSDIKKAYRTLISQNHPDKLVAKGLPESTMTLAKEKTQQITKAYEMIKDSRKH